MLSGWIFVSHQVGSAIGAAVGGFIFSATGSYTWAFVSAALLAFVAAIMALAIREEPISRAPRPAPAPTSLPAGATS
jgi:predicted MFS family arabinose efflux permease